MPVCGTGLCNSPHAVLPSGCWPPDSTPAAGSPGPALSLSLHSEFPVVCNLYTKQSPRPPGGVGAVCRDRCHTSTCGNCACSVARRFDVGGGVFRYRYRYQIDIDIDIGGVFRPECWARRGVEPTAPPSQAIGSGARSSRRGGSTSRVHVGFRSEPVCVSRSALRRVQADARATTSHKRTTTTARACESGPDHQRRCTHKKRRPSRRGRRRRGPAGGQGPLLALGRCTQPCEGAPAAPCEGGIRSVRPG